MLFHLLMSVLSSCSTAFPTLRSFFLLHPPPPGSTLFPYTTLFRSRIRSGKSAASTPMPRTAHILGSVLPAESSADRLKLDSTWVSHVFFPRSRESHAFFGRYEHELVLREGDWRIARKKILLQNDSIPTMLDVYCV